MAFYPCCLASVRSPSITDLCVVLCREVLLPPGVTFVVSSVKVLDGYGFIDIECDESMPPLSI